MATVPMRNAMAVPSGPATGRKVVPGMTNEPQPTVQPSDSAHAAKGVCMNLAFVRLGALASEITEALRPGNEALRASIDVDALVSELAAEYELVRSNVSAYLEAR